MARDTGLVWRRIRSPVYLLTWCLPLAAAAVLALALWPVYRESVDDLDKQVREAIAEEIQGLDEHYHEKGVEALTETIELRVRAPADPDAVYLLKDADGKVLAGNLKSWPDGVPQRESPWFSVPQRDGLALEGRVFELYGDQLLLVGRRSPLRPQGPALERDDSGSHRLRGHRHNCHPAVPLAHLEAGRAR